MVAMSRLARLVALVATLSAAALTPGGALGHGAGVPWIYVEQEQVWPGQPFHVLVLDVAPYVTVELVAELSGTRVSLGSIATGALGHGEADMTLPADFPFGYAQLIGRGDDGSELTTALRVGDVPPTSLPIGPPPAQPPAQPQASPSPQSSAPARGAAPARPHTYTGAK
jgi:hypothetical protein